MARWGGEASEGQGGLLLHGHLDVVPAEASDWRMDPFSGEIEDGYLWGRGAVDMKDFDAMLLTTVRQRQRRGPGPAASDHALLHRRRGGGRAPRRGGADQRASRGVRGRHRRRGRGRRLQHHRARSAHLPHRGRREGHGLDEADRSGPRRPRLDDQPRQRRRPDLRCGRAAGRLRVADPADPDHGGAARDRRRAGRDRGHAGQRPGPGRRVRRCHPDARRGHQQHRQPDDALGRLQGERRPDRGHRPRRRAQPPGLRGRVPRDAAGADRRRDRRRPTSPTRSPGRRRTTDRWWTRCTAACWPRTPTRSSRRTS